MLTFSKILHLILVRGSKFKRNLMVLFCNICISSWRILKDLQTRRSNNNRSEVIFSSLRAFIRRILHKFIFTLSPVHEANLVKLLFCWWHSMLVRSCIYLFKLGRLRSYSPWCYRDTILVSQSVTQWLHDDFMKAARRVVFPAMSCRLPKTIWKLHVTTVLPSCR